MMTSKELVTRAIEFTSPERIPIFDLTNPERSDVAFVGAAPQYWQWHDTPEGYQECTDEFGCTRERADKYTIGQIKGHPFEDWSAFDSYTIPSLPNYRENTRKEIANTPEDKYILGDLGTVLETIYHLRPLDQAMMDFYLEPERMRKLIDMIIDFKIGIVNLYGDTGKVNGIILYDDIGTQKGLLVSPQTWRDFFKEPYKKLFDAAKKYNMHVWVHSCGNIWEIMDDFIEIGANVFNFNQPRVYGVENLGKHYAGKVAFLSMVDEQAVMPKNNIPEIEEEVRQMCAYMDSGNGGLIAILSDADWLKPESIEAAYKAFHDYKQTH